MNSALLAKSERVLMLTASCIRVAVRRQFGHSLPVTNATDLARLYDVPSALKRIAEKMDVHRSRPEDERFRLAIVEATLTNAVTGGESVPDIVKVRRASESVPISEPQQDLVKRLRYIQQESSHWAGEYRHFLRRLGTLYEKTRRELIEISLPPQTRSRALSELEEILNAAIEKAARV